MTPFELDNLALSLRGKNVLLGITGSIAAFKACDIIRHLRACGAQVRVVLTESAERFVTRVTLETLSGQPVLCSLWSDGGQGTHHIDTARWADVALVAPATANTIGKLAQGLANDLLSTELLAFQGPVLVAPAMNPVMYGHPAVQHNLKTLRERGARIIGPTLGQTACGEQGEGRMVEPDEIVRATAAAFHRPPNGKRLVVTLGPTRSRLDPVRYLTNRSSGLMGASVAWAATRLGYEVVAVCGPTDAQLPSGIIIHRVETAQQMAQVALEAWRQADVFVAAAAVLDWDVANPRLEKIKKEHGQTPAIEFTRNTDILAEASKMRLSPTQFVLGFAAETNAPLEHARSKLQHKGCDAIFANDVSRPGIGFESSRNAGWWLSWTGGYELEDGPKPELAQDLLELIEGRVPSRARPLEQPQATEASCDVSLH